MSAVAESPVNPTLIQQLQKQKNWGLVQPGLICVEKYQFLPTGEVLIESNQQRVSGNYQYMETGNKFDLPAIVINFTTDNRKADCAGSVANMAGVISTNFVKKISDQQIYFCLDALGKNCPVYLRPEQ